MLAVLLFFTLACFQTAALRTSQRFLSASCPRASLAASANPNNNNDDKPPAYDAAYFKGLVTEPVNSPTSTSVDGQLRDNLTPNLKFIAIMAGVVGGLFGAFVLANKDVPPPPF